MHRSAVTSFLLALVWVMVLPGESGCVDRRSVRAAPTAALPCPPWAEYPANPYDNDNSMYLGCTNAVNRNNMVETPDDLVRGRPLGPASGERESRAVDLYNQGKTNAAKSAGSPTPTIIMPSSGSATP